MKNFIIVITIASCSLFNYAFSATHMNGFVFPLKDVKYEAGISNFNYSIHAQTTQGPINKTGHEPVQLSPAILANMAAELSGKTLIGSNNTIAFYAMPNATAPSSCVINLNTVTKDSELIVQMTNCQIISNLAGTPNH